MSWRKKKCKWGAIDVELKQNVESRGIRKICKPKILTVEIGKKNCKTFIKTGGKADTDIGNIDWKFNLNHMCHITAKQNRKYIPVVLG